MLDNYSAERVSSVSDYNKTIILAELMVDTSLEAHSYYGIKLYNTSAMAINLRDWILQDAVGSHVIGENVLVPAQGYVLLMQFKPSLDMNLTYYVYGEGIQLGGNQHSILLLDNKAKLVFSVDYQARQISERH